MRILFYCDQKEDSAVVNDVLKFLGGRYDCVAEAEIALIFPNPESGEGLNVRERRNGTQGSSTVPQLFADARPEWLEMV